ncbi:Tol-Pal system beta propeller repeat protein TolB [soil metagenome]
MHRKLLPLLGLLALAGIATPAAAQDQPTGIRLSGPVNMQRPLLAVRPFAGAAPIREAVDSVTRIIHRDLQYSSRYNMMQMVPQQLHTGELDYRQWNALNVVYLVTGELVAGARGYTLTLAAHDVVYGRLVNERRFSLPPATDADFRMAVHALADEIVRWTLNQPGSAATRVTFSRRNSGVNYDLMVVDSDGFGLRRIAGRGTQLYSPVWSPDGGRILYALNTDNGWRLVERDVRTGSERTISPEAGQIMTPGYAPDGRKIVLSVMRDAGADIFEYDVAQQCCLRRLLAGSSSTITVNGAYSPDGRQLAFTSNRAGNPAIYVMPAGGGDPSMLSPFSRGSYYTSPSWAPDGRRVAFHGSWASRGAFHIMIGDATRPGAPIEQITTRGVNEDPSWAPDGRNLVFKSEGSGQAGLHVIDADTKSMRLLAAGGNLMMPEWSPILLRASELVAQ